MSDANIKLLMSDPKLLSEDRLLEWRKFSDEFDRMLSGAAKRSNMRPAELLDHIDELNKRISSLEAKKQ